MNEAETSKLSEAETRAELIDPALTAAGWGVVENSRIRREVIAPGRLIGNGKRAKADIADYVIHDAIKELGSVANISEVFIGFQQYLYSQDIAA